MRRVLSLMTIALAGSLLSAVGAAGAAGASRGGEFGDACVGGESGAPYGAIFELSRPGSSLPAAARDSGVLTKWLARMPAQLPSALPRQSIRLVRLAGSGAIEVTAKSSLENLHVGRNEFDTRLPVLAGEYLALGSNQGGSIVCRVPPQSSQASSGSIGLPLPQPGETASFAATTAAVPVSGVVEPDGDGDGYGDLTQDGCPQSADFHGPCPVLHFSPAYEVGAHTITVSVRSSLRARVAVSGLLPQLGASTGARKTIPAHKLTPFRLAITPVLEGMLHRLDPSRTLRVPFVARVNHVTGNVSTARLTVRLRGRG